MPVIGGILLIEFKLIPFLGVVEMADNVSAVDMPLVLVEETFLGKGILEMVLLES